MTGQGREWRDAERIARYQAIAGSIPQWRASEEAFLEHVPDSTERFLDLGTGDGRLIRLVRSVSPEAAAVGIDFSPPMLTQATDTHGQDSGIDLLSHDLAQPLPDVGRFDLVVSGYAIHHLPDARKRSLYREVWERLLPGGRFLNLEHVASGSEGLHREFMSMIGETPAGEDPSDQLALVCDQLAWLDDVGFEDVDCHWKWRELALLGARRPA